MLVALGVIILFTFLSVYKINYAALLLIVITLSFPYFTIGSTYLRLELILFLILLICYIIKASLNHKRIKFPKTLFFYFIIVYIMWVSTLMDLFTMIKGKNFFVSTALINSYSYLRPAIALFLFANLIKDGLRKVPILKIIIYIGVANCFFSIMQLINISWVTNVTYNHYSSPYRTVIANDIESLGNIHRPVGFFESPVYNAVFILLLHVIALTLYKEIPHKKTFRISLIVFQALFLTTGILTATKTYLLGLPILLMYILIIQIKESNKKINVKGIIYFVSIGIIILLLNYYIFSTFFQGKLGIIMYRLNEISNMDAFASRYQSTNSAVVKNFTSFLDRPFFGYGFWQEEKVVSDSFYTSLLLNTGLIGLTVFLIFIMAIFMYTLNFGNHKDHYYTLVFLVTLVLAATSFGTNAFFTPRIQEVYGIILAMLVNLKRTNEKEIGNIHT